MNYTVYAIESLVDGRIYVGFTGNVENRLKEHNQGKTRSTKAYKPWVLIYWELAINREEARKREKYLKSGIGKEFLKEKKRPYSSMDRMEVS
jgi:putative endonuclease